MAEKITQSIIFLPYFISWVIVGSIAYSLLSYETGTLNGILRAMGVDPINFYGEAGWWPLIIVAFSAWKGVGYGVVVYLASILGVDGSLHEAAAIDGANIFQRIRYITIPSITPTVITLTLLALGKISGETWICFISWWDRMVHCLTRQTLLIPMFSE